MKQLETISSNLRILLYVLIASVIVFSTRFGLTLIRNVNKNFYINNLFTLLFIQGIIAYITIVFLNILLLNSFKTYFTMYKTASSKYIDFAVYSAIYLFLILIINNFVDVYITYKQGFGFNISNIFSFGVINFIYIFIFPYLFIKYESRLKKLKWF